MLSPEEAKYLQISVSDPVKQSNNFGSFVTYRVTTKSNMDAFSSLETVVDRRYSDFQWLWDVLTADFPAVAIPALPEKQTFGFAKLGFTSSSYMEARQRGLEKFLLRISEHPQLSASARLSEWLQASDPALQAMKSQSFKKPDPMAWMEKTARMVTQKKTELERTEADEKFEEIDNYLIVLTDRMTKVSKCATALAKRDRQVAEEIFSFSQGLNMIGQCEGGSLSNALIQSGSSIDQLSQAASKRADKELVEFDEPLQEYVRTMHGLRKALNRRAELRKAYGAAVTDLDAKQTAYQRVQGTGRDDEAKKQAAADKAQQDCDSAKEVYERVSLELQEEFEIFKARKPVEIRDILLKWAEHNISYCQRAQETWSGLTSTVQTIVPTDYDEDGHYNPFGAASEADARPSAPAMTDGTAPAYDAVQEAQPVEASLVEEDIDTAGV